MILNVSRPNHTIDRPNKKTKGLCSKIGSSRFFYSLKFRERILIFVIALLLDLPNSKLTLVENTNIDVKRHDLEHG
jgi:hypothetical protein